MNHEITLAGLDPGFNALKIARVQGDEILTYVLPSSVGEPNRAKKDGLTLAGVVRPQRAARHPFRVVFDRTEYLVGPNVSDFAEPIDRMDFDRFKDSPELRATFYAALYRILNGGAHRVALAIALPVEVVQDKNEALQVERAMRNWMVGEHIFSVDGVEAVLTITTIRAKFLNFIFTIASPPARIRRNWKHYWSRLSRPTVVNGVIFCGQRTITHLQSLKLPAQHYYFDRKLSDGQVAGLVSGQEKATRLPGYVGEVHPVENLVPSWGATKKALITTRLYHPPAESGWVVSEQKE